MKKLVITIATILLAATCFTGCVTDNSPDKAYVKIGDAWKEVAIKDSCEHSGGIWHLKLADGTVMYISAENCILYKGNLSIKK